MIDFTYTLKRRPRRSLSVSVSHTGVVVSAPHWLPEIQIKAFLQKKSAWIKKHLQKLPPPPKKPLFADGEKHLYFGEAFPLKITLSPHAKRVSLTFLYNTFKAIVPTHFSDLKRQLELKLAFTNWYLAQGKKVITAKVNHFCQKLNVSYNKITLKRVSSLWGSCSRKNNLNFNRKLLLAPHAIVDYVIIHEVCHLIHHHHRRPFWDEVKKLDPDYKKHIRWLKDHSHLLTL